MPKIKMDIKGQLHNLNSDIEMDPEDVARYKQILKDEFPELEKE